MLGDVSTGLDTALEGVGTTVDAALASDGAVGSLLGDLDIDLTVLGIGVDVSSGTIGVDGLDAALDELSNTIVNEPLVDPNGIVSIDLANGTIAVDLAAATTAGSLNGLDANTELLDTETTIPNISSAIAQALGSLTTKVTEGVTEVLNETSVTLELNATLSYLINNTAATITLDTTLGQLAGTGTGTPTVEIDVDGGVLDVILGLLGLSLSDLVEGLATPLLNALVGVVQTATSGLSVVSERGLHRRSTAS